MGLEMTNSNESSLQDSSHVSSSTEGSIHCNGNSTLDTSCSELSHNSGISVDWTPEEHAILEQELAKHSSEPSVVRYAKIALQLENKTVRDVVFRCRWLNALFFRGVHGSGWFGFGFLGLNHPKVTENGKKRREENFTRQNKDKKERTSDLSSQGSDLISQPNLSPSETPDTLIKFENEISCKGIGGSMGELLEQNARIFSQISFNLSSMKVQENIGLFCQTRDNISHILINLGETPEPEAMKLMPPLPVKLNEDLADAILPSPDIA